MNFNVPPNLRSPLAIVLLILSGIAVVVTVSVTDTNNDGKPDTVQVVVNKQAGDGVPTKTVVVPEKVVEKAADTAEHSDLDAAPPDSPVPTDSQIEKAAAVQTRVKALPEAGAVQGFDGCATRIIPVNYSSRNGARPTWFVLHYTVSHNIASSWTDVNAIISLFSNSARQASSNFVIDAEGHCAYIVPIEAKAWTQAGGNPWSISVEVIAFGDEPNYLGAGGWAKLKSVAKQVSARTGIPLRQGLVSSSCTPIRSGIVQHKDFGLCGGGHVDISPFSFPAAVQALSAPATVLTAKSLKLVRSFRHPAGTGHSKVYWRRRIGAQIGWLVRSPEQPRQAQRLRILRRVWGEGL